MAKIHEMDKKQHPFFHRQLSLKRASRTN
ncbi:unnamed protein product [Oikopleura dioica]|uniref:Uncharacterized protein n=1 Tax=Oikopleura dioica TaxID=34765 RepID=E4YXH7_OIKDI|nr:unnamed protein product [Oikopleura dioica]